MNQTVFKGLHFSLPPIIRPIKFKQRSTITWVVKVDEQATYNLNSPDQLDWNKLLGVKKKYFNSHYMSAMLAHRWNPNTNRHEFAPYIHDPTFGITKFINEDYWFDTPIKAEFEVRLLFIYNTIYFSVDVEGVSVAACSFSEDIEGLWWEINLWFGGNKKAPSKYSIKKYVKKIIY
jgi:hypothetical protein